MAVVEKSSLQGPILRGDLLSLDAFLEAATKAHASRCYDHVELLYDCDLKEADGILARMGTGATRTPFQKAEWLDAFGVVDRTEGNRRVTAVVHADGQPVIVMPLRVLKFGSLRYLTWQAHTPSDYCAPILAPGFEARFASADAQAMLRDIAAMIGGIDLIYLPKMPNMLGRIRNPLINNRSWRYYTGVHAIRIEGRWEKFYAALRSSRTRQSVKRKEKALRALGLVEFSLTHDPESVAAMVQTCLDMKTAQLSRDGHSNLFSDRRIYKALQTAMVAACPQRAWAASLALDGRTIATAFGMIDGDKWLLYQLTMSDGPEAKFSPGVLLLVEILKVCVEREVGLLDLALGDEAYKLEWCNLHTDLRTTAIPLTMFGEIAALVLRTRERARNWLAQHPRRMRLAKRIKPLLALPKIGG